MKPLIDTCILIDYLQGHAPAATELSRYEHAFISAITWMEVMIGATADDQSSIRRFLARYELVEVDANIRDMAVAARQRHRMRLPDAIIYASAGALNTLLVTRNTKDFPTDMPFVRVPYQR